MPYTKLLLRPGKDHIPASGHPWIFSQATQPEVQRSGCAIKDGEIIDIYSSNGKKFLARGYYNSRSQIVVRILTRDVGEEVDARFFEKRFRELLAVRERFIDTKRTNAFRIVFGESDGMPGLIVDKYNGVFVIQIHTLGMETLRKTVITAMQDVFHPETIFERSDVGVRLQEGLPDMPVGHIAGKPLHGEVEILENGIPFLVNVAEGQKTGFFLDQRENRRALQQYVRGKRLLNCFCYTAGFSLYAALAGALETVSVDLAKPALETAKRNFERSKLSLNHHQFIAKDVFEALSAFEKEKTPFDIIILDPPAFVKNQKSLEKGLRGYLYINESALKLLPTGGILVSSSCSAHVTDEMFQKMLSLAAGRARCGLKALEIRHQPVDHPYNVHFPEGKYLKFYVMLKV